MSDYGELKRLAEDAVKGSENWLAAGMLTQLFVASCTPSAVLALITENERLKAENEAIRRSVGTHYTPPRAPLTGPYKCIACGECHYGTGFLPCPKMSPAAKALSMENQRIVPVKPVGGDKP